jgi:hypothetical protein
VLPRGSQLTEANERAIRSRSPAQRAGYVLPCTARHVVSCACRHRASRRAVMHLTKTPRAAKGASRSDGYEKFAAAFAEQARMVVIV